MSENFRVSISFDTKTRYEIAIMYRATNLPLRSMNLGSFETCQLLKTTRPMLRLKVSTMSLGNKTKYARYNESVRSFVWRKYPYAKSRDRSKKWCWFRCIDYDTGLWWNGSNSTPVLLKFDGYEVEAVRSYCKEVPSAVILFSTPVHETKWDVLCVFFVFTCPVSIERGRLDQPCKLCRHGSAILRGNVWEKLHLLERIKYGASFLQTLVTKWFFCKYDLWLYEMMCSF